MLSPSHDYLTLNNTTQPKEMILRVVVVINIIFPKKYYFSFLIYNFSLSLML